MGEGAGLSIPRVKLPAQSVHFLECAMRIDKVIVCTLCMVPTGNMEECHPISSTCGGMHYGVCVGQIV